MPNEKRAGVRAENSRSVNAFFMGRVDEPSLSASPDTEKFSDGVFFLSGLVQEEANPVWASKINGRHNFGRHL